MKAINVYVVFQADGIDHEITDLQIQDDAGALGRFSQALESGGNIFKLWAEGHGGRAVALVQGGGVLEVAAECIADLPELQGQYEGRVECSVSIGVGVKLSDAQRALLSAQRKGRGNIRLYDNEVEVELAEELSKAEEGSEPPAAQGSIVHNNKTTLNSPSAGGGMKGAMEPTRAGPEAPMTEASEHSENEVLQNQLEEASDPLSQFTSLAEQSEGQQAEKESSDAAAQEDQDTRKQLVDIIQAFREQAPVFEQLKESSPELYKTLVEMIQAMIQMGQQLYGQPEGGGEQPVQKSENLEKALPKGARLDVKNPGDQTANIANRPGFLSQSTPHERAVAEDQLGGVTNPDVGARYTKPPAAKTSGPFATPVYGDFTHTHSEGGLKADLANSRLAEGAGSPGATGSDFWTYNPYKDNQVHQGKSTYQPNSNVVNDARLNDESYWGAVESGVAPTGTLGVPTPDTAYARSPIFKERATPKKGLEKALPQGSTLKPPFESPANRQASNEHAVMTDQLLEQGTEFPDVDPSLAYDKKYYGDPEATRPSNPAYYGMQRKISDTIDANQEHDTERGWDDVGDIPLKNPAFWAQPNFTGGDELPTGVPAPNAAYARSPIFKQNTAKQRAAKGMTKAALEAGKTGRHNVILPVGSQKDPSANASRDVGQLKVQTADGKTKWRSVRAGLVRAPDGSPVSSRNPGAGGE